VQLKRSLFGAALLLACGGRTELRGSLTAPIDAAIEADADAAPPPPCATEIVASDPHGATALALDGDVVFWGTEDGLVRTRDVYGTTTTLATEPNPIRAIAVDASNVYWTELGAVKRVARAGGTSKTLVPNAGDPFALVVTSDSLYWLDDGGGAGSLHASVLDGTSTANLGLVDAPGGLALDGTSLYYTASASAALPQTSEPLVRYDTSSGVSTASASNLHDGGTVVAFGGRIYFLERDMVAKHGGVRSVAPLGGLVATELHTDFVLPSDFAVDSSGVYATVLSQATSLLVRADDNEEPVELASTDGVTYTAVRTSTTAIYWTIAWTSSPPPPDGASVRKLCK
jgi:hypothetical protein